jgi:choline monooxygenase
MDRLQFDFDEDLARASTLPARLYTDPAVFDLERRLIFHRTWQIVGRTSQLTEPGSYFTSEILGEPVVVVRARDGAVRAFANVCRHRAGPVAEGAGCRTSLQCRYHGWTYGLDGRLLTAPEFDGVQGFSKDAVSLPSLRVGLWEPFVFVNLESGGVPLVESLEDIPGRASRFRIHEMTHLVRKDYVVECNWKTYVDNYLEGYHIPLVHPSLNKELDYAKYNIVTHEGYSQQQAPIRRAVPGTEADRLYGAASDQTEALYLWVFPNLMLNIYPDNLQLNVILPLTAERTLTVFEWFFHNAESPEIQERAKKSVMFADEVQKEDMAICERVQRGLRSTTYDRGRYSVRRENGVHHFHSLVHRALTSAV